MIEVAGAIIHRSGRVLLGRRSPHRRICPNTWDLIGGHVEPGEGVQQALKRELFEEVGLRILKAEAVAAIDFSREAGEPLTYHLFSVTSVGEPRLANAEHTALRWFSFAEARALPDLASSRYRPYLFDPLRRAPQGPGEEANGHEVAGREVPGDATGGSVSAP